jgi:hypothetical protein
VVACKQVWYALALTVHGVRDHLKKEGDLILSFGKFYHLETPKIVGINYLWGLKQQWKFLIGSE